MTMTRRELITTGLALGATACLPSPRLWAQSSALVLKKIPSSGEALPVVGIGTARRFDVAATAPERAQIKEVLRLFAQMGGRVIDTAPSYGQAEVTVGDLVAELGNRKAYFLATKVGTEGREAGVAQLEASMQRLKTDTLDLVQVHNLRDFATQMATLREWKAKGRIRYVGASTSSDRQYPDFEQAMRAEAMDVIQVDYALDNRNAAERILPLAADRGMAVLVNLPFGRGRLFQAVQGKPLPEWTKEFDCASWAQFFLKYIVSHPAVTCAVPGTAQVKYVTDNLGAAQGRMPDAATRTRMEQFIDAL
jgi:aryl-alcohol dehydrogenase-like predicted oxidoreductase